MRCATSGLVVAFTVVAFSLPAQSRPTVRFTFDWSPGTRVDITTLMRSSGTLVFPNDTFFIRGRSTLEVDDHADGRVIRTSAVKVDSVWPQVAGPASSMAALPMTTSRDVAVIVRSSGEFVALADTLQVRKSVDSLMSALSASSAAVGRPPISMSALSAAARNEWEQRTSSFLARTWTIGNEVADSVDFPVPVRAGSSLRIPQRTVVVAVEACDVTTPSVQCARVHRVQAVDEQTFKASILESMKAAGADVPVGAADYIPQMSLTVTTDMVLEVKTLRPHRFVQSIVQSSVINGVSQRVETSMTSTYRYTSR
jgi:hypothetical protein